TIDQLILNPVERMANLKDIPHPHIPLPRNIYITHDSQEISVNRLNSKGLDLSNEHTLQALKEAMEKADKNTWTAGSIINGDLVVRNEPQPVLSPANKKHVVGQVYKASAEDVQQALANAASVCESWA